MESRLYSAYRGQFGKTDALKQLISMIDINKGIDSGKGSSLTNISDQLSGQNIALPFNYIDINGQEHNPIHDIVLQKGKGITYEEEPLVDKFFRYLETCRRYGVVLHFAEKQSFQIAQTAKTDASPNESDESLDDSDDSSIEDSFDDFSDDGDSHINVEHSGIMLDFDLYQESPERQFSNDLFNGIISIIAENLHDIIDNNSKMLNKIYAVVVDKDISKALYGDKKKSCYKESFHIIIPGVQITRATKHFLIHRIISSYGFAELFDSCSFLNPMEDWLDKCSANVPNLFFGSCKRDKKKCHKFHSLYKVTKFTERSTGVMKLTDFDPIEEGGFKKPKGKGNHKEMFVPAKYKYNLCYELSLNFQDPKGLIKKSKFDCKPELALEIRTFSERHEIKSTVELEETDCAVSELVHTDFRAKYLSKILSILNPSRASNYASWKSIVIILARTDERYKPLAVSFSQRCAVKWADGGAASLDSIWQWAVNHKHQQIDEDSPVRTIKTLYAWAKSDNPDEFEKIRKEDAFSIALDCIRKTRGKMNDYGLAKIIHASFSERFIYAVDPLSLGNNGEWWQFVMPDVLKSGTKAVNSKAIYKYFNEGTESTTLQLYIMKQLPDFIGEIVGWLKAKQDAEETTEQEQQDIGKIIGAVLQTRTRLGNSSTSRSILGAAKLLFTDCDFIESLDQNPMLIGVNNGVLQLKPTVKLINKYHQHTVSRTVSTDYMPYDPDDPTIKELEDAIRLLFGDEEDAYIFIMCHLASSIDGYKGDPLYVFWLGVGSNGKSFLTELHLRTFGDATRNGYCAKGDISFLTNPRRGDGGPNSSLMSMKPARSVVFSESDEGDALYMSKLKELSSEMVSASEKHKKQENFTVNATFIIATNNEIEVKGTDHGTWRRLLSYTFKMKFMQHPDPKDKYQIKVDKKWKTAGDSAKYRRAYFSIMTKWYKIFNEEYGGDLDNIPRPTIDRETQAYRESQDVMSKFIKICLIHVGPIDEDGNRTASISMGDLIEEYVDWYKRNVNSINIPSRLTIAKEFGKSSIGKYFRLYNHQSNLTEHTLRKQASNDSEDSEFDEDSNSDDSSNDSEDSVDESIDDSSDEIDITFIDNIPLNPKSKNTELELRQIAQLCKKLESSDPDKFDELIDRIYKHKHKALKALTKLAKYEKNTNLGYIYSKLE